MVIWITGLSGSGKSTLCDAFYRQLKPRIPTLVKFDGDEIRAAFGADLGHAEGDRVQQIKRIQGLTKLLVDQGIAVLVAALYSHPDLLAWNRENLAGYFEVYIKAELDLLCSRDPKALYRGARIGEIKDVVGVDIPWREPQRPDFVVDAASAPAVDVLVAELIATIPHLSDQASTLRTVRT